MISASPKRLVLHKGPRPNRWTSPVHHILVMFRTVLLFHLQHEARPTIYFRKIMKNPSNFDEFHGFPQLLDLNIPSSRSSGGTNDALSWQS